MVVFNRHAQRLGIKRLNGVFATLLVISSFLVARQSAAEPIIVNKPAMESPKTTFDSPELQAAYDQAWKTFAETVEAASAALTKELKDRVQAAQDEGNLDLVKHWTEVDKQWEQTGEFEWDADEERRKWERFAPSVFPHSVTIAARGTAETHKAAIEELQGSYKELEQGLVKAGDTKRAGEVRKEIAGLLEANDFKNDKGKRTGTGSRLPLSKIRDQFVGEWSNPTWKYVNILVAQKGTTDRGKAARRQSDGRITDGGTWLVNSEGKAKLVWQAGGARGWNEFITLFPSGLIAGSGIDPKGALRDDGWVAWQEGFDWRGERCRDVEATPQSKANIAGDWTHPNWGSILKISESGEAVEERKSGSVVCKGSVRFQDDGSHMCSLSTGWKWRFWVHGDVLALLPFRPTGDFAGDGLVCERIK